VDPVQYYIKITLGGIDESSAAVIVAKSLGGRLPNSVAVIFDQFMHWIAPKLRTKISEVIVMLFILETYYIVSTIKNPFHEGIFILLPKKMLKRKIQRKF
jgi:hypothetical protein